MDIFKVLETIVKKIFEYINDPSETVGSNANFVFIDNSNTDRSDFYEASDKMILMRQGYCYDFFALSKAFFEYFGIENKDIRQTAGAWEKHPESTHFWSMVNIGTASSPKWYYYDSTRNSHSYVKGCLFSEAQRAEYNNNSETNGFYTFDSSAYPQVSNITINSNYTWN